MFLKLKNYHAAESLLIAMSLGIALACLVSIAGLQTSLIVLAGLTGAGIGFAIVASTALKPYLFWPILIVGSIVSTGFMPYGYTMIDEYVVGCMLLGSFTAAGSPAIKRHQSRHMRALERLHQFVFLLLIMYILFECFRGIVVLDSPRKIRWVVFYLMLGVLVPLLYRRRYHTPPVRKMAFLVVVAALFYFGAYVGYGVLFEFLGVEKFELQFAQSGSLFAIWGSTAYTMFPLVIAMPAIFIVIKDRNRVYRWTGWITLLVSVCTALYYDSRISILTITAFVLISLFNLGIRKWLIMVVICMLSLSFFFSFVWKGHRSADFFLSDTYGTISSLWQAEQSGTGGQDINRYVWMKAGVSSISDNWRHFLFGYGFRTSGYVVAPHVYDLFRIYQKPVAYSENVATEAITNLLVDTGVVGVLLLIINFVLVALQIWMRKGNPNRNILVLSLFAMFAWLFVINIVDVMLLYLMIMPSGILVQLSRYQKARPCELSLCEDGFS